MDLKGLQSGRSLTRVVIAACIEVHRHLGPGLLESAYEECLCHELAIRGLRFERQSPIPLEYKGMRLDCGYRADVIVDEALLLELKVVERVLPIHKAQVVTYLKLTDIPTGLLMNFNVPLLVQGLHRVFNPNLRPLLPEPK